MVKRRGRERTMAPDIRCPWCRGTGFLQGMDGFFFTHCKVCEGLGEIVSDAYETTTIDLLTDIKDKLEEIRVLLAKEKPPKAAGKKKK
jgi:RecJ-like exonuclease